MDDDAWLDAMRFARARVELDPDDPEGHLLLGKILLEHGRLEGADDAFRRVLQIEPGDPDARYFRAVIADSWGRSAYAAGEFSRLVARFPDVDLGWQGLQWTTGRLIRGAHARFALPGAFAAVAQFSSSGPGQVGEPSVVVLIALGLAAGAIALQWLRTRRHLGVRKLRSLVRMAVRQDHYISIALIADAIALAALLSVIVTPSVAGKPLGGLALAAILFATVMHAFKPRDPVPESDDGPDPDENAAS